MNRVRQQPDGTAKSTLWANVFAEGRNRITLQRIPKRDNNHKDGKNDIFQVAENPGHRILPDFQRRNLMQKLLKKPQRAQKTAYGTAKGQTIQHQNAQYIAGSTAAGCSNGILQSTQRAGTNCPGTGVAIQTGNTKVLYRAGINISGDVALQMGIVQQGSIQLDQPPLCWNMGFDPVFHLIQGQYTPYKY